jgi:hypothetical protein
MNVIVPEERARYAHPGEQLYHVNQVACLYHYETSSLEDHFSIPHYGLDSSGLPLIHRIAEHLCDFFQHDYAAQTIERSSSQSYYPVQLARIRSNGMACRHDLVKID